MRAAQTGSRIAALLARRYATQIHALPAGGALVPHDALSPKLLRREVDDRGGAFAMEPGRRRGPARRERPAGRPSPRRSRCPRSRTSSIGPGMRARAGDGRAGRHQPDGASSGPGASSSGRCDGGWRRNGDAGHPNSPGSGASAVRRPGRRAGSRARRLSRRSRARCPAPARGRARSRGRTRPRAGTSTGPSASVGRGRGRRDRAPRRGRPVRAARPRGRRDGGARAGSWRGFVRHRVAGHLQLHSRT